MMTLFPPLVHRLPWFAPLLSSAPPPPHLIFLTWLVCSPDRDAVDNEATRGVWDERSLALLMGTELLLLLLVLVVVLVNDGTGREVRADGGEGAGVGGRASGSCWLELVVAVRPGRV
jgi:hypothetical protein